MADLTIIAASVRPLEGCIIRRFTAGEVMTPGQPVYLSGNNTVSLCDASAVATNGCIGLVVSNQNGAVSFASGDPVDVVLFGPVNGFATNLAAGTVVYTDDDAGVLADAAGTKDTVVGIGLSTTVLLVRPQIIDFA
jgi:hypothetical protein